MGNYSSYQKKKKKKMGRQLGLPNFWKERRKKYYLPNTKSGLLRNLSQGI